jgi:hypothetical protein
MTLRLKDVPQYPAYLVCHDGYDNGAMEIWPVFSLEYAQKRAAELQTNADNLSIDSCMFRAYAKLPRKRVWRLHQPAQEVR